jgi:DNA-binding LacI/PurR family transcriptional regulator
MVRATSLADIARLARLSTATVSRVLSGAPGPSQRSRDEVLAAAAKLGYTPNALARAMSTLRSGLIGIAVADLEDPFFTELLAGAQQRARQHRFHLLVSCSHRDPSIECGLIEDFRGYRAEGIVLCGTPHRDLEAERKTAAGMAAAQAGGTPIIQIGIRRGPASLIHLDFSAIATDALRYLLRLGHRAIGYVGSNAADSILELHLGGIRGALAEAGITPDPELFMAVDARRDGVSAAVRHLVARGATAIIGADDMLAVAVILALREAGLAVPGDVSVMGMDGTALPGQILRPAISTVALPVKALGELAVEEIVRIIGGGAPRYEMTLPHEVVARESTAAPRAAHRRARPAQRGS